MNVGGADDVELRRRRNAELVQKRARLAELQKRNAERRRQREQQQQAVEQAVAEALNSVPDHLEEVDDFLTSVKQEIGHTEPVQVIAEAVAPTPKRNVETCEIAIQTIGDTEETTMQTYEVATQTDLSVETLANEEEAQHEEREVSELRARLQRFEQRMKQETEEREHSKRQKEEEERQLKQRLQQAQAESAAIAQSEDFLAFFRRASNMMHSALDSGSKSDVVEQLTRHAAARQERQAHKDTDAARARLNLRRVVKTCTASIGFGRQKRSVVAAQLHPRVALSHLLLVAFAAPLPTDAPSEEEQLASSLGIPSDVPGVLAVFDTSTAKSARRPACVLLAPSAALTTATWHPDPSHAYCVLAGTSRGQILAWDVRQAHRRRRPLARSSLANGHAAPVVRLLPWHVRRRRDSNVAEDDEEDDEEEEVHVLSVCQDGRAALWTQVPPRTPSWQYRAGDVETLRTLDETAGGGHCDGCIVDAAVLSADSSAVLASQSGALALLPYHDTGDKKLEKVPGKTGSSTLRLRGGAWLRKKAAPVGPLTALAARTPADSQLESKAHWPRDVGDVFAAVGFDGHARLWHRSLPSCSLLCLSALPDYACAVAWSPCAAGGLAVADVSGSVSFYDVSAARDDDDRFAREEDNEESASFAPVLTLSDVSQGEALTHLSFGPLGRRVVVCDAAGCAHVLSVGDAVLDRSDESAARMAQHLRRWRSRIEQQQQQPQTSD